MPDLNIIIAFLGGLVSFFAPCVVPLLPAYIGYVTGVSVDALKKSSTKVYKRKILISSLFYILGFSLIFVLLGTAVGGIGSALRHYTGVIQKVGGLIMILLGLEFAGVLKITQLAGMVQPKFPSWAQKGVHLRPFLIGMVFAVSWSPCVGAVLGSILALAASTATWGRGALMLFVYSLGISLPFVLVALSLASAPKYLPAIKKRINLISKIAGFILALVGVMLLTDTYKYLNTWLAQALHSISFLRSFYKF